jgi:hypothetical protein
MKYSFVLHLEKKKYANVRNVIFGRQRYRCLGIRCVRVGCVLIFFVAGCSRKAAPKRKTSRRRRVVGQVRNNRCPPEPNYHFLSRSRCAGAPLGPRKSDRALNRKPQIGSRKKKSVAFPRRFLGKKSSRWGPRSAKIFRLGGNIFVLLRWVSTSDRRIDSSKRV